MHSLARYVSRTTLTCSAAQFFWFAQDEDIENHRRRGVRGKMGRGGVARKSNHAAECRAGEAIKTGRSKQHAHLLFGVYACSCHRYTQICALRTSALAQGDRHCGADSVPLDIQPGSDEKRRTVTARNSENDSYKLQTILHNHLHERPGTSTLHLVHRFQPLRWSVQCIDLLS